MAQVGEEHGPHELERDAEDEGRARDVLHELRESPGRDAHTDDAAVLLDAIVRAERRRDPVEELREVVPPDPPGGLVELRSGEGEPREQFLRREPALAGPVEAVPYEARRDLHGRRV